MKNNLMLKARSYACHKKKNSSLLKEVVSTEKRSVRCEKGNFQG